MPEPGKSQVILEMASDLESLFEHYRRQGHDADSAARLAEERLIASPEAVRQLVMVHTTGYQRFAAQAVDRLRWGFDMVMFGAGVVPLLAAAVYIVVGQLRRGEGGTPLWIVLSLAAGVAAIAAWKAFELLIRRERSTGALNRGLFTILFLGLTSPLVGGVGFLLSLRGIGTTIGMAPASLGAQEIAARVAQSGSVLALGMLVSIAAALVWFVLVNRIAIIEREECRTLLGS